MGEALVKLRSNGKLKNNGEFVDEEAEKLDCGIAYYIPHDVLMNASDDEIFKYIYENIEEYVIDVFNEE